MPTRYSVLSLSRVCRAWFDLCTPVLYRQVRLKSSQINAFYDHIRVPESHMRPHIRKLRLLVEPSEYSQLNPLNNLAKALRQTLTHLEIDRLDRRSERLVEQQSQNSVRINIGTYSCFSNITFLRLSGHTVSSSQDLFRLFGSLAFLAKAELSQITWRQDRFLAPFPKPSRLIEIICHKCTAVWPFLLCSTWSRFLAHRTMTRDVVGLSREEAVIAARICQYTAAGACTDYPASIYLEMSSDPHTCTYVKPALICESCSL